MLVADSSDELPGDLQRMATHELAATSSVSSQNNREVDGCKPRLQAAGLHLAISAAVASCVICVVYLGWYRAPLEAISGVGSILIMLLAIDVTLGPLLTLVLFDRSKKSLRFDLTCIALLQVTALTYGIYTVEAGRPHYLVFVKDRFEAVSRADLRAEDRDAGAGNSSAEVDWLGPKIIAASTPDSVVDRNTLLLESALGGRDVQHFPKRYRDYSTQARVAAAKARPLGELRDLNPRQENLLRSAASSTGLTEDRLGFLPIRGPQGDASMLIETATGAVKGMVALQPWR